MKLAYSILLASLLGMASSQAATISWSSSPFTVTGFQGETLNTGQFNTNGTLVLAQNVGGAALTFDGINFAAGTINFGATFGGFASGANNTAIAAAGTFNPDNSASTVNLTGLNFGEAYRIQALIYDGRGDLSVSGRTVRFDTINQGQYANGVDSVTWGSGLLVTGTFVADALTQNFTIETFGPNNGSSVGSQINAITVFQIPEPSSALLGGFGVLALLRRRR